MKNEGRHPLMSIRNSTNILIVGHGGPGVVPDEGKVTIENSDKVRLTNLTHDWGRKMKPLVHVRQGETRYTTAPGDHVILLTVEEK